MRFFVDLSYSGKKYHGWQYQANATTVQQTLESCFSNILGISTSITGAGRTDTGVHARQMIAHFDAKIPLNQIDSFIHKLNSYLAKDIQINSIVPVISEAHARFDAESRSYGYYMVTKRDVFNQDFRYFLPIRLDLDKIHLALKIVKHTEDFRALAKTHSDTTNFKCQIFHVSWQADHSQYTLKVTANRFLRGMIRCMVGTLIEIGKGKIDLDQFEEILNKGDRSKAGYTAPAKGLFLESVCYNPNVYLKNGEQVSK